ncbi:hypothetical protein [Pontibacter mucosus]|nr:hypothetical protein [Pontibacter mucosus]
MKSHTYTLAILLYFGYTAVPDILVRNQRCCGLPSPRKPYFYTLAILT